MAAGDYYIQIISKQDDPLADIGYLDECLPEAVTFLEALLRSLNVDLVYKPKDYLFPKDGPVVVVANHPFGGIDGFALLEMLRKMRKLQEFDTGVKLMMDYSLSYLPELRQYQFDVLHSMDGSDYAAKAKALTEDAVSYLRDGNILAFFPAGEVASFNAPRGYPTESEWDANIATIIHRTKATVVPVSINYGHGLRYRIYRTAWILNLLKLWELPDFRSLLLTQELLVNKQLTIQMKLGNMIKYQQLSKKASSLFKIHKNANPKSTLTMEQVLMNYLRGETLRGVKNNF